MKKEDEPGFVIPINHSVLVVKMFAGVPADFMIVNALFVFCLVGFFSLSFVVVFPILHILGVFLTKKDQRFVGIFGDYLKQAKFYD